MLETFSSAKFLQLSFSISILFCYKKMIFFIESILMLGYIYF